MISSNGRFYFHHPAVACLHCHYHFTITITHITITITIIMISLMAAPYFHHQAVARLNRHWERLLLKVTSPTKGPICGHIVRTRWLRRDKTKTLWCFSGVPKYEEGLVGPWRLQIWQIRKSPPVSMAPARSPLAILDISQGKIFACCNYNVVKAPRVAL